MFRRLQLLVSKRRNRMENQNRERHFRFCFQRCDCRNAVARYEADDHAGLLPTVRMELYREVVPLKLAVPFGEHGAFRTAEAGADTFWLGDRECLCIRVVRPAREACISGKKLREDKLRRTALRRKRHHQNIGEVIRDVLTVDGDDAV